MTYKPSRNFLASVGLLVASFFIMHGLVIPSIAETEMQAAALKAAQTRPALISGIFRKSAWEEFDQKARTIRETNISYYIEKTDGKTTKLNPKGKVDESLLDQYVEYDPLTQRMSLVLGAPGIKPAPEKQPRDKEKPNPTKKVLVLLSEFSNSTGNITPAENYEEYLFGPNGYVRKFYSEMTHGQVEFEADVPGLYHFNQPGSNYSVPGQPVCGISAQMIQHMADYFDRNIQDYDLVISIGNCEEYDNLGGTTYGPSELGGVNLIRILGHHDRLDISEMQNYTDDWPGIAWNVAHEIGHTLGVGAVVLHSSSLDCGEHTIASDCTTIDYGNPFDVMGGWSGRIFSFAQQLRTGFIDQDNILEITGPGAYHLDALQTDDGIVGATITVPGLSYPVFALEHRKATGFDSGLSEGGINAVSNGLLLYSRVKDNQNTPWPINPGQLNSGNYRLRLVDPRPASGSSYDAITLTHPFHDEYYGLSISIIGISDTGIDFLVDYDADNALCSPVFNLANSIGDVSSLISSVSVDPSTFFNTNNYHLMTRVDYAHTPNADIPSSPLCQYGEALKSLRLSVADPFLPGWNSVPNHFADIHFGESGFEIVSTTVQSNVPGIHNPIVTISDYTDATDSVTYPLAVDVPQMYCDSLVGQIVSGIGYSYQAYINYVPFPYPNSLTVSPFTTLYLSLDTDYSGPFNCPQRSYNVSIVGELPNGFSMGPGLPANLGVSPANTHYPLASLLVGAETFPGAYTIQIKIENNNLSADQLTFPIHIWVQ